MVENHKIKRLIEDSPLSLEKKRLLLQYMELKGVDMKFFDMFLDYLGDETKDIVSLQKELDDRATREKERIEERLEQELVSIDPTDFKTKTRIWEEYYDALDELGGRYNKRLQEILSNVATA